MASKIRVLSDLTINQIAAGEVIENPASVVKELVENAIDAGATRLTIEVFSGGFQSIKVSDNGSGMTPDDAVLSLERHATSKIASAEDLFSLATMGFRGEALASIAAVSKMTLTTATESATAITIEVEGGKITQVRPAARLRGTTIEVRSLFYNVPARKKFQKSVAMSNAEITKAMTQLALAYPEVGIELIQQNRTIFSFTAENETDFFILLKKRVDVLLNREFLSASRHLEFEKEEYKGKGLISNPSHSRHNRSGQYLFVNRRPVVCPAVSYALQDAYGTRLTPGRHPVYVLHLSIPSSLVDVNVHPQKKEIRLREENALKAALHAAVHASFSCDFEGMESNDSPLSGFSMPASFPDGSMYACEETEPLGLKEEEPLSKEPEFSLSMGLNIVGFYGNYLLVDARSAPSFLFQNQKQSPSGILWFDLPAVAARLQYDALVKSLDGSSQSQGLLVPATLSFSRAEAQLLTAHEKDLQKLGLQMRLIGDSVFLIESIPPFLEEGEIHKILEELIDALHGLERNKSREQERLRKLAACISRKIRMRKKNYHLTEARLMVEKLMRSEDPEYCPQGGTTLFFISEEHIEDYFKANSKF